MSLAKSIYHRIIPESVRNPIGLLRRRFVDRLTRLTSHTPLPPARLLSNVQMTTFVSEFIGVGRRSAEMIQSSLSPLLAHTENPRVLDFGCGCGRTLLHLRRDWTSFGCDVDADAIAWLKSTIDGDRFQVNDEHPPLPWEEEAFDVIYAVSVFTHFSDAQHVEWRRELARLLRPSGLLAVTTMGPGILSNFPVHATTENRELLETEGFFFVPDKESFNANAAFHTTAALSKRLAPEFDLVASSERGLDGFQDLSVFRRS